MPASQKQRTSRFRNPAGCDADDACPEHLGTFQFNLLDGLLPPKAKRVFLQEATEPMISRVYAVSDTMGEHVALWQLRTVTVLPEPRGLIGKREPGADKHRHFLVPFVFDTTHPHVHLGKKAFGYLLDNGALEGQSHLAACNVEVPLPNADVRCVRTFGPSKLSPTNDERKNTLGAAASTAILAVQAAFDDARSRGVLAPCETGDAAECDGRLSLIARQVIERTPTLQARLRNIVPKDTASAMAIRVTTDAQRQEREEAMIEGIKRELLMLSRAPQSAAFDEDEFISHAAASAARDKAPPSTQPPTPQPSTVDDDDDEGEF